MSHESDNDMVYDLSDVEFTKWLVSNFLNYKTMDHYTMKALWIYWARCDDEVKLTDEESSNSDDKDEMYLLKILMDLRLKKNIRMIGYISGIKMFYGCIKDHGRRMEGNLPRAYIIGNILHYQDLEWYEALKDGKLKEEALKNKDIMDEMIDDDDESSNEGWKR
nr:hypothetical protein [Tanacetum cinerariifolium]